jgi:hypothetical protein
MTFDRLSTLAAVCLLPVFLLPSPALAQSFQGTFKGDGVMMTLQPSRDRLYGTLVFDGGFYSVEADEADGVLTGSFFTANGDDFDFKATFRGNRLALETNSVTYLLRRAGPGAVDEPEPEMAAVPEPPAPAPPAPDRTLTSMDFERGKLPSTTSDGRPAAAEPVAARIVKGGPVDENLVGAWQRGAIDADAGNLLAAATDLELAADGTYAAGAGRGQWKAQDRTLYLRSADGEWQPHCRYKLVGDTLLCTVDEDSRQLWFRR